MLEIVCEELAHRAGFLVSVGNWIAPDGSLISSTNYQSHHWETLIEHLGEKPSTDNHLSFMNDKVSEGYLRLVFRADVLFQVGCQNKEEIWEHKQPFIRMMEILRKLEMTDIHIFSKTFYVVGRANDIVERNIEELQIREQ